MFQDILSAARRVKLLLILASEASALYCDVSNAFVLPAVDWLKQIHFEDETHSSENDVGKKVDEIESWRKKISKEASELSIKVKQNPLQCFRPHSLHFLVRDMGKFKKGLGN